MYANRMNCDVLMTALVDFGDDSEKGFPLNNYRTRVSLHVPKHSGVSRMLGLIAIRHD